MVHRFNLFLILFFSSLSAFQYDAEIHSPSLRTHLIREVKLASSTFQLQDKPPASLSALKRRAELDIENIQKVLAASGYLSAQVTLMTQFQKNRPKVIFSIIPGPQFHFDHIETHPPMHFDTSELKSGKPVSAFAIEEGERTLIAKLRNEGYPLAKIDQKVLIADKEHHTLDVTYIVSNGPTCIFGPVQIAGNKKVDLDFFTLLTPWKEGEPFSNSQIAEYQARLEKSGLFKAVTIREEPATVNKIPILVLVEEAPMRTIGAGINYTTTYGPGVSALWSHRNLNGMGTRLDFKATLWFHNRLALIRYTVPNFLKYRQNLIYLLQYEFTTTISYVSSSVKASALLESKFKENVDFVRGVEVERLHSKGFDGDHLFRLGKLPLQLRFSTAEDILDPKYGLAVNSRLVPTFQAEGKPYPYLIHTTTLSLYKSFFNEKFTLALKGNVGNIFGESENLIPLPDRFFGGSDNSLRGYKTLSVAPLNHNRIPVGGRSILTGTVEARLRTSSPLGWVLFYDTGNVYRHWLPQLEKGFFHSVGLGIRYTTPIGPVRLDIGFPLNRREKIDPPFQIYFSIGQAF